MAITPNTFPEPQTPGSYGLAAADAHYSMAPFLLGPDEALVMTGRWPECRFANVCLWNRFQQTFDYVSRAVSLNRTQTEADEDGRFSMILAHEDPGRSQLAGYRRQPVRAGVLALLSRRRGCGDTERKGRKARGCSAMMRRHEDG